jgi:hypothetical protein
MSAVEHGEITATNGQSNLPHWQKDREGKRQNVNPRAGGNRDLVKSLSSVYVQFVAGCQREKTQLQENVS